MKPVAFIDYRCSYSEVTNLRKLGLEILQSSKILVDEPMNGHPDLQIFLMIDTLFLSESTLNTVPIIKALENLKRTDKKIVISNSISRGNYPKDVPFNAVVSKNYLICNKNYIAKEILEHAKSVGKKIIHVNQGYVRCTTLPLFNDCFITSDLGIHKVLKSSNISSFFVEDTNILLPGYNRGFIGGTSGTFIKNDSLYILTYGDLKTLNVFSNLDSYIRDHSLKENFIKDVVYINISKGNNLIDKGGIIII